MSAAERFPESVLAKDERVLFTIRPYWQALLGRVPLVVVVVAAAVAVTVLVPANLVGSVLTNLAWVVAGLVALAVFGAFTIRRATRAVVTDQRVIVREGLFTHQLRDVPLARVTNLAVRQSLVDRLVGGGTLTISAAGRDHVVLPQVPAVDQVMRSIHDLLDPPKIQQNGQNSEFPRKSDRSAR